ncbi:MAG: HD domain-containing phosphohydrolase [Methylococcales bacterium]
MNPVKETILIVDDQIENLTILGELLESHYRVRIADGGARALRAVNIDPQPDLILLDVMMPDINGYDVLTRLKADPATKDIPVIFVTSKDSIEDEEHGLELGAADYILKPVKPLVLLARVYTQIENRRAKKLLKNQNHYLELEIERRMHHNEVIQSVSLAALSLLAETRDSDTGNHIYRTQHYVALLAQALQAHDDYREQLDDEQLSRIIKAAPLHDIGKVGIPDHILCKPGILTKDEFAIMQTHTVIGANAIAKAIQRVNQADTSIYHSDPTPMTFLEVARQMVLWHHERWDGTGYPDKLSGTKIPLPARIMALADVYDALISNRVYKKTFPILKVEEIIISERGRHFDPVIVDVFIELRNEFEKIAIKLSDSTELH